jgi:hypothetical protein
MKNIKTDPLMHLAYEQALKSYHEVGRKNGGSIF